MGRDERTGSARFGAVGVVAALCLLATGCTLYGWGANSYGQLGDGTRLFRSLPVPSAINPDWASVDTGDSYSCGIDLTRALYCWGHGGTGQLGTGPENPFAQTTPARVGTANDWLSVSAGGFGGSLEELESPIGKPTCGVRAPGDLYCWGVLGGVSSSVPIRVGTASDWTSVSAGAFHVCGIRLGDLYCWGRNNFGQLGDGTTTDRLVPTQVGTQSGWRQASTGSGVHTCGVRAGRMFCWGHNLSGQLGDGTTTDRLIPTQVGAETNWVSVGAGGAGNYVWHDPWVLSTYSAHSCGKRAGGTLWCWGENTSGQLGDGTTTNRVSPVAVSGVSSWRSLSVGGSHTCAIQTDARLYCWGVARGGFFPTMPSTPVVVPTKVALDAWSSVSAGPFHTMALRAEDSSF